MELTTFRAVQVATVARATVMPLMVLVALMGWSPAASAASAPTLTMSPGPGHPYQSGTSVSISVGPNARFTPYSRIEILECAAPKGILPVDDTTCDGNTAQYGSVLVGADGRFDLRAYTIYSLPNSALGEQANHAPVCNRSEECVLYIGQDQNNFTQPRMFSPLFTVVPSSAPATTPPTTGRAPGATGAAGSGTTRVSGSGASGSAGSSTTTGSGASGTSVGSGSTFRPTGVLAYTGLPGIPWMVGIGTLLVVVGAAMSRRRRNAAP